MFGGGWASVLCRLLSFAGVAVVPVRLCLRSDEIQGRRWELLVVVLLVWVLQVGVVSRRSLIESRLLLLLLLVLRRNRCQVPGIGLLRHTRRKVVLLCS